jgi:phosphate transport system ATP-binding protein
VGRDVGIRGGGGDEADVSGRVDVVELSAWFGEHQVLADVNLSIEPRQVTALIGPSGSGKSTVLRCINALHFVDPKAALEGEILLDGVDVYGGTIDMMDLRRRVGMVFQRPNPFPTMSIYDNVVAGIRLGRRKRSSLEYVVEQCLTQVNLWHEVRDRLNAPGGSLSGGQQQRLCIARAIAIEPEVLLMDEPCSSLDPISTLVIEDLITSMKSRYTIVIVTHNMQQAARVSEVTAFLTVREAGRPGELVEVAPTSKLFSTPAEKATEDYVTGRVG